MIPSIVTPPTDNLYKFISLFGLAIFLFAMYSIGVVYDQCVEDKMKIEDLKIEVAQKYYEKTGRIHNSKLDKKYRRLFIKNLDEDVIQIQELISKSSFSTIDDMTMNINANKIKVSLDNLRTKRFFGYISATIGFLGMLFGFFLWKRKEQDIRDKILEIEHIIKQNERDKKGKSKKKKHKKNEILAAVPQAEFENN